MRSQLSKNDRKKFNTVLIVDVHNRDIIDRFVRDRFVCTFSTVYTYVRMSNVLYSGVAILHCTVDTVIVH